MFVPHIHRTKSYKIVMSFILALLLLLGSTLITPVSNAAEISGNTKIVVMLNLTDVTDWPAFDKQMKTLKDSGVYGVEVDMWWNHFEPQQGQYDWSYYKTLFTHISDAGLKIAPIFSFHQCGTNVGDTCYYPLPNWVWSLGGKEQMEFKSESGYYDNEYIAPWYKDAVNLYDGAFKSFAQEMASFKSSIDKFHIGMGPAGELRYPSYNFNDTQKWNYPSRGLFQAYSESAIADFQASMQAKYGNIAQLNTAWGTSLADFSGVQPPANGDTFYSSGDYAKTYGVDFLSWYQGTLETHFTDIITKAHQDLDGTFGVDLSAKMPGIHWQYSNPAAPHSAEQATGLYDYAKMLDLYQANNVDLTFTCLEMTNAANGYGDAPNYSKPQDLVAQVSELAKERGIVLEGENALSIGNAENYLTISDVLKTYDYDVFTLLRLQDIVKADGSATQMLAPFMTVMTLGELPVQSVSMNVYDPEADPVNAKVYIVGNSGSIGDWNPDHAVPATYQGNGFWQLNMDLKASVTYEFKAIRKDASNNTEWGADPNLTWTVPYVPGGTAFFKANIQRQGQDYSHKHYITGDIALDSSMKAGTTVSLTNTSGDVLAAVYDEEKQTVQGATYGVISTPGDTSKVRYYFEVPNGSYQLRVENGSNSASMTIIANSQTLEGNDLIDNVPDLQPFILTQQSFSNQNGVTASVKVSPTVSGVGISHKVVIFMLMDGTTPVGINAVGVGAGEQELSTYFNVTGGNYKLGVFVVDSYDIGSITNVGTNLADPLWIQN
ncbi:family 14 glycosylhydrolase [Paenibacillus hexagrammi]|uniref:Beta-amylase n=1 Tax=Paenibacillus hexagrammi TaxID=2908839 RepID=A0ABY3SLN5_9BACL|nr:family 14 glycosylhydrolase [Paenibacillus sp. YPD9-1]UJF34964.1 family 14 glycosylhydrolase [Paenibacillus sp. YPD9-1]